MGEPSMGGKQMLGGMDDCGGMGGKHQDASGPQGLASLAPFDHSGGAGEALNTVGRTKVKAGIKLEPIQAAAPPLSGGSAGAGEPATLQHSGMGVRNSASV